MAHLAEQLALLRRKIQLIDAKFAETNRTGNPAPEPFTPIEDLIPGQIVDTPHGQHFETEKFYERYRRHGNVEISDLFELPHDLLDALSDGAIPNCHPARWAFLDTETTGLVGGSGTYPFLIGVGAIESGGFRVRQFFMRDYAEEKSQLHALNGHLSRFDVLVTYNGKTFDQPLLETRYTMTRTRPPFARMEHLDLLAGARRLWKARLENCKLSFLEEQILGVERHGDVPGSLIPQFYFEYVRSHIAFSLVPVFYHNVMDIVTLACLTALVPQSFRDPSRVEVRHGADLLGLSRWLISQEREEEALGLMRRSVELGLPDRLLFKTLLDIGLLEKKRKNEAAALAIFTDLVISRNPCRARAYEELAKYYEHTERNYAMALEMTESALAIECTKQLQARRVRLRKRLDRVPRLL